MTSPCLPRLTTPPGASVDAELDVLIRGPSQTHTLLDSHLPLSSKPSYHLHFPESPRLVYVVHDSFTVTVAQQTTPSANN